MRTEVASALDQMDFGIICVTSGSQHAPWLMFEAGALAKHLKSARVVPLYIDLGPTDVTGPLADWQGRRPGSRRHVVAGARHQQRYTDLDDDYEEEDWSSTASTSGTLGRAAGSPPHWRQRRGVTSRRTLVGLP